MSAEKFMKLTFHRQESKSNTLLESPISFMELKEQIASYLKGDGNQLNNNYRMYWIDEDGDEIDIVLQKDYDIFLKRNSQRLHLHVMSLNEKETSNSSRNEEKYPFEQMFPTKALHTHVECDGCKVKPIVGFRYKCIECHNFDLCQKCEATHAHSEHMMVRLPHDHCPNVIEAWVTGRARRSHKRGSRGHCPFVPPTSAPEASGSAPGGGDSERHHHNRRSHKRRDMNPGLFGHLYKMMQDLAEGGVKDDAETSAPFGGETSFEAAANAASAAATAAASAAAAASNAAAQVATEAFAVQSEVTKPEETAKDQSKTGATPKTPPTTPNNNAGASGSATNAPGPQTEPVLNSPSLENLAQYIDPQYMRAGIQILNNFSEMFAKMLDPSDGVGMSNHFEAETFAGTRKNSTTTSASTSATPPTSNNATELNKDKIQTPKPEKAEINSETDMPTSTTMTPPVSIPSTQSQPETLERSRSQSVEENDWQLIDKQALANTNEAVESGKNLFENGEMAAASTSKSPQQSIDFAQLSRDLKAHIDDEKKREANAKQQAQIPVISATTTTPTPTTSVNANASFNVPIVAAPSTPAEPIPQPRVPEEKRGVLFYHPEPRINNAVHAMMAMGFSNEGACLTQLLESVNGNIPEALDLMNAVQRNNN